MKAMPINQTRTWKSLVKIKPVNLSLAFHNDSQRAARFSVNTPHLFYDYSRQLISQETLALLHILAKDAKLGEKIKAMFSGKKINATEGRAVLHVALRDVFGKPATSGEDHLSIIADVANVLNKIKAFSGEIDSGKRAGVTGKKIKNIVSIGIGGSYLGPEYLAKACRPYAKDDMNLVFVANVDGTDFAVKTKGLDPEETLFVIVSKTFTTAETMMNAGTAKKWMLDKLNGKASEADIIKKHFIAVSTAKEKVEAFGIDPENMFVFWDWVGGRYSATSAVGGVPLSLYLGFDNFKQILEGAHWMDLHYKNEPFSRNIPVISALIDIWNINFLGHTTRALLPYSQLLAKLPAHTQQVES